MSENFLLKLKKIRAIFLDVDGTLTDGKIYLHDNGEEMRAFDMKDGAGLYMAKKLGFVVALISGKKSEAVKKRADMLEIENYFLGERNKIEAYEKLKKEHQLRDEDILYMGDDINDYFVMKKAGVSVAVFNAHPSIKHIADYITKRSGGNGAVREIVDLLIEAQDLQEKALEVFEQK